MTNFYPQNSSFHASKCSWKVSKTNFSSSAPQVKIVLWSDSSMFSTIKAWIHMKDNIMNQYKSHGMTTW